MTPIGIYDDTYEYLKQVCEWNDLMAYEVMDMLVEEYLEEVCYVNKWKYPYDLNESTRVDVYDDYADLINKICEINDITEYDITDALIPEYLDKLCDSNSWATPANFKYESVNKRQSIKEGRVRINKDIEYMNAPKGKSKVWSPDEKYYTDKGFAIHDDIVYIPVGEYEYVDTDHDIQKIKMKDDRWYPFILDDNDDMELIGESKMNINERYNHNTITYDELQRIYFKLETLLAEMDNNEVTEIIPSSNTYRMKTFITTPKGYIDMDHIFDYVDPEIVESYDNKKLDL